MNMPNKTGKGPSSPEPPRTMGTEERERCAEKLAAEHSCKTKPLPYSQMGGRTLITTPPLPERCAAVSAALTQHRQTVRRPPGSESGVQRS